MEGDGPVFAALPITNEHESLLEVDVADAKLDRFGAPYSRVRERRDENVVPISRPLGLLAKALLRLL